MVSSVTSNSSGRGCGQVAKRQKASCTIFSDLTATSDGQIQCYTKKPCFNCFVVSCACLNSALCMLVYLVRYSSLYSPRVLLLLLTVKKIESENFDFVLLFLLSFFLSFFLSSFPSSITQKLCGVYERSAHQTNVPSEIFLFFVRAACELRSTSYGPKHASRWLSCTPFCA